MKRDQIKDRILKRAAKAWGFSGIEMETSFDPIISVMINSLSYELEKISNELQDANAGIVERILEIMFPENSIGVRPAQAILHASPLENNKKISLLSQLVMIKRINNIYNALEPTFKEIAFSPTIEVKLSTCKLKYLAYGTKLYEISGITDKKVVEGYSSLLPSGEVFIGIELSSAEVELEDLMLYIDIKDLNQKEMLHYYLKNMKCFYDHHPINIVAGYNVKEKDRKTANLNKCSTHLDEIQHQVNQFYFDQFYTLKGILKHKKIKDYDANPDCFETVTNENERPIIWLKLVFIESLIPQIIDTIIFQVNCFPVINKRLHKINTTMSKVSFVTLDTEKNRYLDIEKVINEFNEGYEINGFTDNALEEGTASLRTKGTSKFDTRSGSEMIQKILDLLKDEGSSFSYIGKDFASETFSQISQLVQSIEKQAGESRFNSNNDPHLIIKPRLNESVEESVDSFFWSTTAEEGNNIKAGTKLIPQDNTFDANKLAAFITTSVGGTSKQTDEDRIFFYRNALLTRGRIVTIADIKAFIFNHFKSLIFEVEIKKGTRIEVSIKEGLSKTLDIYMKVNKIEKEKLSVSEWDYLCESFIKQLKRKSSNVFPYRLYIN